jgi:hypothetical protein
MTGSGVRNLGGVAAAAVAATTAALDAAAAAAAVEAAAAVAAAALGAAAGPVRPTDGVAMATAPRRAALLAELTDAKLGLRDTDVVLLES